MKTKKELSLSYKEHISEILGITYGIEEKYWYAKKDVKEFIKRLKEELMKCHDDEVEVLKTIDKLAGEKLI